MLTRAQKEALVKSLREKFEEAQAVFVTSFKGLTANESNELRKKVREAGGEYRVVKNTLLRIASSGTPAEPLQQFIEGPTGIALAYKDPVALAKVLTEFAKEHEALILRGAALQGKPVEAKGIEALAKLPPREVLLAQLLGLLQAPPARLVQLLANVLRSFLYVLKAIEEKKRAEGGQ
ncbi:50S ribosomal protein L10 [Thermosulfurimonas marina]|uniref:Large ribosomal subunit protein uL10 n=1 Tax=Thermosulfurimonas marina TaxID=2047767 RepID=A0A6H1WRP5_9BACT|nr:50S ribosomal protein L10 [Thermosulfurimonas marina]QJA05829.1 50S ribosomal protein L10 [Thermosulfurimonas marina]